MCYLGMKINGTKNYETLVGFRVNADAGIIPAAGKAKPQIRSPSWMTDGALFGVGFLGDFADIHGDHPGDRLPGEL